MDDSNLSRAGRGPQPDLKPSPDALVWRMDASRDRLLTVWGPQAHAAGWHSDRGSVPGERRAGVKSGSARTQIARILS